MWKKAQGRGTGFRPIEICSDTITKPAAGRWKNHENMFGKGGKVSAEMNEPGISRQRSYMNAVPISGGHQTSRGMVSLRTHYPNLHD